LGGPRDQKPKEVKKGMFDTHKAHAGPKKPQGNFAGMFKNSVGADSGGQRGPGRYKETDQKKE